MQTWIALLRGINVGGNHIIPMKELVDLLESNGFLNVRTCIQSGNVVYESEEDQGERMGNLIEAKYGFKPAVFTLSKTGLKNAVDQNPFKDEQGKYVHFFFLDKCPDKIDYDLLNSLKAGSEAFKLMDNVFYLYAPDGIGRSKLAVKVGSAFPDVRITARNLNTINKISAITA